MEGPSVAFPWPWIRPGMLVHPWNILSATVNAVLPDHELTHQINARGFYFLLSFFFFSSKIGFHLLKKYWPSTVDNKSKQACCVVSKLLIYCSN